jgi:quercetin dioxygenase-like cupin family protein
MANPLADVWFENARVGQRARLLTLPCETEGRRFVLEYVNRAFSGRDAVPSHLHPTYTETFEILSGRARYRLGRGERTAMAGDRVVLPAGVAHVHPWNDGAEELHVRQTAIATPSDMAGLTASLQAAITLFGLATAGRVNARGMPGLLQLAVLADETIPATYLAGVPRGVQRVAFRALARLGRTRGYRTAYPEYGVVPGGPATPAPA